MRVEQQWHTIEPVATDHMREVVARPNGEHASLLREVARVSTQAIRDGVTDAQAPAYMAEGLSGVTDRAVFEFLAAQLCFGMAWARNAFPVVQPGHKYAASLMSTVVHGDVDVRPPWDAFAITLPHDMLGKGVREIAVYKPAGTDRWVIISDGETTSLLPARSTAELLEFTDSDDQKMAFGNDTSDLARRFTILAQRLVVGVCLSMSDPACVRRTNEHSRARAHHARRQSGEPKFLVYQIGRPVTVDCRQAVADYLAGRPRSPRAVQTLVRGHWRNQACGPRLSERRLTWIEPFWKGPDDAPINVRLHRLHPDAPLEASDAN